MYLEHFGLSQAPFNQDLNRNGIYYSFSHEEALTRLLYTVNENKGAALLTGAHGAGKTLLLCHLKDELLRNGYQVAHLVSANLPEDQFIEEILYQLGIKREGRNTVEMLHALHDMLRRDFSQDRELVIIIDEVQYMTHPETFIQMHQLLNFHVDGHCPITLILSGEPGVQHRLDDFGNFAERIVIKAKLDVFNREDTQGYLSYRLEQAGSQKNVFSSEACDVIHRATRGVPRSLNHVADLCLLIAASEGLHEIDETVARNAVAEWQGLS